MDRQEFFDSVTQPGFPDQMAFQIERDSGKPQETFSQEALDGMNENLIPFIASRIWGRWQETGVGPKKMTVNVSIDWEDDLSVEPDGPWWNLGDKGAAIDGLDRVRALALAKRAKLN